MSESDFARQYGPWAVITGGSEGVGAAFASRLAEQGINLILVARKPGPLEELAKDIRARYGREVITLSLDLTESAAVQQIIARSQAYEVGMLVHNAGADSRVASFLERPLAESEDLIALNVLTPTRLVRHFAPMMVERQRGGVVLLSSFASCVGTPGNLVYAATKAFSKVTQAPPAGRAALRQAQTAPAQGCRTHRRCNTATHRQTYRRLPAARV
jgi:short-subunit dehydrogenase